MNKIENKKDGSSFAFWSFVLGILSVLPIVGILTAVLSIIFGSIAIRSKKKSEFGHYRNSYGPSFFYINKYLYFFLSKQGSKQTKGISKFCRISK